MRVTNILNNPQCDSPQVHLLSMNYKSLDTESKLRVAAIQFQTETLPKYAIPTEDVKQPATSLRNQLGA
jgi:hypothetical protein